MRNAKETLDYYNRKFVVNITGLIDDTTGVMEFNIPPPNEVANNNNYNQCIMRIKEIIIANATANLADQVNPVFVAKTGGQVSDCLGARGSKQILETPIVAAAAGTEHAIDDSVNFFYYQDGSSFEDGAVLCANPFGSRHSLTLRDAFNGVTLGGLASGINTANGRNSTQISMKLEILMLPNPTPMDRV